MLVADRAGVPLWEFMRQGTAWREYYRLALMAERKAEHEVAVRRARQAKMAQSRGH